VQNQQSSGASLINNGFASEVWGKLFQYRVVRQRSLCGGFEILSIQPVPESANRLQKVVRIRLDHDQGAARSQKTPYIGKCHVQVGDEMVGFRSLKAALT
jgi:hypothetical protein